MGLFDKKYCDICGEKIGLFGNKKLTDGNMCGNCQKKLSRWFHERRESSLAQIREQLAYREENAAMLQRFHPTRQLGFDRDQFILIDEQMGRFVILREGEDMQKNPDLFELSKVRNVTMEIKENRTEVKRKDASGNTVPYTPPHYRYSYQFLMTMLYDGAYFSEVKFPLTTSHIDGGTDHEQYRGEIIGNTGSFGNQILGSLGISTANVVHTTQTGQTRALPGGYRMDGLTTMTAYDQQKYRDYEALGNEIIAALTGQSANGSMSADPARMIQSMAQTLMSGGGMQSPVQALQLQALQAENAGDYNQAAMLHQQAAELSLHQGRPDFEASFDYMKGRVLSPDGTEEDARRYLEWAKRAKSLGIPADRELQEAEQYLNRMQARNPQNVTAALMAAQQQAMMQAQQQAMAAPAANGWQCSCGNVNTGNFCMECGAKKPEPTGEWRCSCGNVCAARFCTECGSPRP